MQLNEGFEVGSFKTDALRLVKDYSFVVVHEYAVVKMETDRLSKCRFFQISAFANKIRDGVAMSDPGNVLMNDRAFIEVSGGVMSCGSN